MLLNCHTYYSFCYGTLSPEELIELVLAKGYNTFVLSDINNTSAVLDAIRQAQGRALDSTRGDIITVIPGIDFRNGIKQQYLGIARNNTGFTELNTHLSDHLHHHKEFRDQAPCFENAWVIYPLQIFNGQPLRENEFIGISARELPLLPFSPARHHHEKLVILQPLSFADNKHFNAHRLLRAIGCNTLLSKLPASEQGSPHQTCMPRAELLHAFAAYPLIIRNTEQLLASCNVNFRYGKLDSKNRRYYTSSTAEDLTLLRDESYKMLHYRYPQANAQVKARLEKELEVIAKMNFASYFLINWDITTYARNKGYYYVGRGSGANSIVAYLLRITDVDPIELDLYFERFINEYRNNAPDFDIDFSWTDRDDVTRYIFERFGREHTSLLGTYATFQHDSVTRELGKVFGLPAAEIDRLQGIDNIAKADHIGKLVLKYSRMIHGFPSHLSVHSSGILISEEPMMTYTATFLPPKGYPTTQFSMLEAEDIGLFKFDILSQRGLGKIRDAVDIVKENRQVDIDIHEVQKFKTDETVKQLLRVGKCIGCFYVESPAMRMLLAKLRADDYLRLVAASSIIRPGVSKSGMMREYIARFRDAEKRKQAREALPELYDLLEETYGVMVYQEDVIRIAHLFAGLSLEDSDYLRRGMSWKFKQRNEFWRVKQKFFDNCRKKGHPEKTVQEIWNQIESFANFAFSKGHSASYAVESYQALYLKAHYPLEYMVATLNNGGGFYRPELYVHEARMHGGNIMPPCVNSSGAECRITGAVIHLGLGMINSLEAAFAGRILEERAQGGSFNSLYDFIKRTGASIEQLRLLIRAGAFRFLGKNKKELLWEAYMFINPAVKPQAKAELFDVEPEHYALPPLENSWIDDAFDEIELLGFSLCPPFALLQNELKNTLLSADLSALAGKTVEIVGYLVSIKHTRTSTGERMYFGTFLDRKGYWLDTVHFPPSARLFPFTGPGCYRIIGKVVDECDFIYVEVSHQYRLAVMNREERAESRMETA
jgi:DNA polymerase III subunit alpha